MIHEKIKLKDIFPIKSEAVLECFIHGTEGELDAYNHNLPAAIVCPGGAYLVTAEREGEPIAMDFYNRKYNVFILWYSVAPNRYPLSLSELAISVDYVKRNSEKYNINSEKLFVLGFSAGGHLVASLGNFWNKLPKDYIGNKKIDAKAAGIGLGYPVISFDSHEGSFINLLGENFDKEKYSYLSLDTSVTKDNLPTFIWTTREDTCVKPDTSYKYATALLEKGVKHEFHLFPYGGHGGATCDKRTHDIKNRTLEEAKVWIDLCDEFFQSL